VVVGVVSDFNFNSLHTAVAPIMLYKDPSDWHNVMVRLQPGNPAPALAAVREHWQTVYPEYPFEYYFLDAHLAELYQTEQRAALLSSCATGLAIAVACLGLFGLALFTVQRKSKEIGIRKVLGASVAGITGLLTRDFLKLVLIAIVIASPIAWYFMKKWLADFAYRIDLQWWMFAAAGAAAMGIAFLTVGAQSVKAALANPVKSLRSE
jgi:putative ABC transport system permease protein